jgi:hypothetical protein
MRDRAHRIGAQPARPRQSGAAPDAAVAAVLGLQRRAGNAAVTGLIRASRRAIQRQPTTHTFELGEDVSVDFAKQAKSLAKDGTVTAAELPALHTLALKDDETVGDAERMFMAGLLDPANAALIAAADIKKGTKLTFTFAAATTAANLRTAADVGRQKVAAAALTKEEATKKILELVGSANEQKAKAVLDFRTPKTQGGPFHVLSAMLAAASDSTPADMLAAAAVYGIAASAKHPLRADIQAGNIKVDAVSKVPARPGHPGSAAVYVSHGSGKREKGDTLYLQPSTDITNLYHRSLVIHELEHAAHDKAAKSGDLDAEETGAYEAQMAYALEQIAAGNTKGIAQMASGWNVGLMCGAVLASGKDTALQKLTKKINKASTEANKPDDEFLDKLFADTDFRPKALRMVADADAIAAGALTAFEGLKGESLLQAGTP